MMGKQGRAGLAARLLEGALWAAALGCAGWWGAGAAEARIAGQEADRIVVAGHPAATAREAPARSGAGSEPVAGAPIGRLELPAIGLRVPVLENYDAATLRRGVGHVPGTATPGGLGNLVLAGHRDTFFRPLREVHAGMEAQVITAAGRWRYVVDGTEVVDPDRVEVLEIGERPEMTLITCFPFDYIGAAPRRFIVHAHLVSVEAG